MSLHITFHESTTEFTLGTNGQTYHALYQNNTFDSLSNSFKSFFQERIQKKDYKIEEKENEMLLTFPLPSQTNILISLNQEGLKESQRVEYFLEKTDVHLLSIFNKFTKDLFYLETYYSLNKNYNHSFLQCSKIKSKNGFFLVKYMLEKKADIHFQNDYAIQLTAKYGNIDVMKYFIEKGLDVCDRKYNSKSKGSRNLLRLAAKYNQFHIVRYLVEVIKVNVCARDNLAVREAASHGHLKIVKYLVENGADIYVQNNYAVRSAAQYGHLDMVKYLVEDQKADIFAQGNYAICSASMNGHLNIVKYIIQFSFQSKYIYSKYYNTIQISIQFAAKNGHLNIIKYLIEYIKHIHSRTFIRINIQTAAQVASQNGYLNILKYLHENGTDINYQDDSIIRVAVRDGHLDIVKYLVEQKADIHYIDNCNDNIFNLAIWKGHLSIAKYLVEQGIYTRLTDVYGKNALQYAIENNRADIIEFLNNLKN
jgi:ankyrin repeat protein